MFSDQRRHELESLLSAYLDGELTGAQRAEVEAFVAEDAQAAALLTELQATVEALNALPRAEAPPQLVESMRSRLERRALLGEEQLAEASHPPTFLYGGRWVAAAAVIALTVVAGYVMWSFTGQEPARTSERFAMRGDADERREVPRKSPEVPGKSPSDGREMLLGNAPVAGEQAGKPRDKARSEIDAKGDEARLAARGRFGEGQSKDQPRAGAPAGEGQAPSTRGLASAARAGESPAALPSADTAGGRRAGEVGVPVASPVAVRERAYLGQSAPAERIATHEEALRQAPSSPGSRPASPTLVAQADLDGDATKDAIAAGTPMSLARQATPEQTAKGSAPRQAGVSKGEGVSHEGRESFGFIALGDEASPMSQPSFGTLANRAVTLELAPQDDALARSRGDHLIDSLGYYFMGDRVTTTRPGVMAGRLGVNPSSQPAARIPLRLSTRPALATRSAQTQATSPAAATQPLGATIRSAP